MIEVERLSIEQGSFRLSGIELKVPAGGYGVLMGRTGSGKTTILEALCGLRPIRGGVIRLGGRDVAGLRPAERGVGYVPQDGVLFPSMSVREHLAFPLRIRRWSSGDVERRVHELAEMLGIEHLLGSHPGRLSGGERQRVALGRALAFYPPTLCLDEPLSALDDQTREQMYTLLAQVRCKTGVTVLHVTHSRHEAIRLGDVLLHLSDGRILPGLPAAEADQ